MSLENRNKFFILLLFVLRALLRIKKKESNLVFTKFSLLGILPKSIV
jgi:hypothetical protein